MTDEARKPVEVTQADAWHRFELWLFRECNEGTRRHLWAMFGLPIEEISNHGIERHALKYVKRCLATRPTRPTPSSDMVEAPRPYPHATGEGTKYQECYSFDDGSLTVRTTGYGERCGTGWLCFPEDALEQEQDDETGKWYQVANLANSELIFLRDTLNAIFPSHMAAKDAQLAELRAEIEALGGELTRLKMGQWFYLAGDMSSDRCRFSPSEVIDEDWLSDNRGEGSHVVQVEVATPLPDIWCAVHFFTDAEKGVRQSDDDYELTEHASEAEARAALGSVEG